jgi:hypothetical protein
MRGIIGAALAVLVAAAPARAQDRPKDEDIFGAPEKKPDQKPPNEDEKQPEAPASPRTEEGAGPATTGGPEGEGAHAPPSAETARDDRVLGEAAPQLTSDAAPDNPLAIGGQVYLRAISSALQDQKPRAWSLSTPALVDTYFDARPNKRVRAFVLGRMFYDPTLPPNSAVGSTTASMSPTSNNTGSASLSSVLVPAGRGPQVVLDQLWLRFDVQHTVFVTAGKQHVRWGTARFWTPADFLHVNKRNPLEPFDARSGTTMLKLHVPWEEKGWNFYAYGLTEGPGATPRVSDVAGAARAEVVFGTAEAGVGAMVQQNRKPKLAADLSMGVWDFDLYGEVALRYGSEIDRVGIDPTVPIDPTRSPTDQLSALSARYPVYRKSGLTPQVTGGINYSLQYASKDVLTFGGEYFYNGLGYSDPNVYLGLLLPRNLAEPATFFYLGKHYAALFASAPAPYNWDLHSFTVSVLGNLSDRSFIGRFDYSYTLLTHLRLEAYVALHFGKANGEFRFGVPEIGRAPGLLDLGVALRVAI